MKKRLLAWLSTLAILLGLLPVSVLAYDQQPTEPQNLGNRESAAVDVEYDDTDRTTATITYHKEGVPSEPVNLIFLVDVATTGRVSHKVFESMMWKSGLSYIYDYGVQTNPRLITYQNMVLDSGYVNEKFKLLNNMYQGITPGEGNANELVALQQAIRAVGEAENSAPTVVFWVLGNHFGWQNESEIENKIQELTEVLGDDGALITWQFGDTPNELLSRYATHYGDAHNPNADMVAAYASTDIATMQNEMSSCLERVAHDHYHNINFSLNLAENQSMVTAIKKGYYVSESSHVDLSSTLKPDGKGIDVHLENVCRQADIDFVLEVELNPELYEAQTVMEASEITVPADHSNGGLHTGIFDDGTLYDLRLQYPAVVIDRTRGKMTFQANGADGDVPVEIQQMVGSAITIPDGAGLSKPGSTFGGWNVVSGPNQGTHYKPGQIIPMPSGDMTLQAAWGHVEVELELGNITVPVPTNNLLAEDVNYEDEDNKGRLSFEGMQTSGGVTIHDADILSVTVTRQSLSYNKIGDVKDPHRVQIDGSPGIIYARHVGATDGDKVVAYLMQHSTKPGKYDLYIAGPNGVKAPADISSMFCNGLYPSLETADLNVMDTSGVTNMCKLFYLQEHLTSLDISRWDTSRVADMSRMFYGCKKLTELDVKNFDTSQATTIAFMFYGCSGLTSLDLHSFNTSNVIDMSWMFRDCFGLTSLDVSSFDTSKVTDMTNMFANCYGLTSLTLGNNFNPSQVKDISWLFYQCSKLTSLDLGDNFNTSSAKDMSTMFSGCSALTSLDVSGFNTSNVGNMASMFSGCSGLTSLDVSNFDTSKVRSMSAMFSGCSGLTSLNLRKFNTPALRNTYLMFSGCSGLTSLDLSSFITSNVTNMGYMFSGCSGLTNLALGENFDTAEATNMEYMFSNCGKLTSLDLGEKFVTSSVDNMRGMFLGCYSLTRLDLGNHFDISKVQDISNFLTSASPTDTPLKLEYITGIKLGEENYISDFQKLFYNMSNLKSVTFITPDNGASFPYLHSLTQMFYGCSSLQNIDLGNWKLPNLTNTYEMFSGCTSLAAVNLSWSGMRADPYRFNSDQMFQEVPDNASLEIGDDVTENTQVILGKIAYVFPGNVTINGAPRSAANSVNTLPLPDESTVDPEISPVPEETPSVNESEEESDEAADLSKEPAGTPEESPGMDESLEGSNETDDPSKESADTPEETPGMDESVEESNETDDPSKEPAAPSADIIQPDQNSDSSNKADGFMETSLQTYKNVRSTNLSSKIEVPAIAPRFLGDTNNSIIIHEEPTPVGTSFTYLLRIKYAGDTGAQSGRIDLTFPLPDAVSQSITETRILVSDVEYSEGSASGFKGGQIVVEPYLDTSIPGNPVLRGTFEGLYAGNEYEVQITCVNETKDPDDDGYTYWDAVAYGQDGAGSVASKVYRLWYKDGGTGPNPDGKYSLAYAFSGNVPPDAVLPTGGVYTASDKVAIADTPTSAYDYYTFDGWKRSDADADADGKVKPGETNFSMPNNDVILIGTWTLDENRAPKITVTYEYTNENEAQHIPEGAPSITPSQEIIVGNHHSIFQILEDVDHHVFCGWQPTLVIDGQPVDLNDDDQDGIYVGSDTTGKSYTINTSGVLYTEQFRNVAGPVTVAYAGPWRPYTGTIEFDANGGDGSMAPMQHVTWDTRRQFLTENKFTHLAKDFIFAGWALSPSGHVVKADKALADGLIDEDNKTVTLYAIWKRNVLEHTITVSVTNGTASPGGSVLVEDGSNQTITFTPYAGYVLDSVTVDGSPAILTENSYTFTNIKTNHTIDVVYQKNSDGGGGSGITKYPINVKTTDNGTASSNKKLAAAGETVVITTEGIVEGITATDENGKTIKLTDRNDGSYTFKMPASPVSVLVDFASQPSVVDPDATGVSGWLNTKDHIAYLAGYHTGLFLPDKNMTRAEASQMFYNLLLEKDVPITVSFSDVPEDAWYSEAVNTLASLGILMGVGEDNFAPDRSITRAEFTVIAMRFTKGSVSGDAVFSDVTENDWFYDMVVGASQYGWITGYEDGTFLPNNTITRGEVTTITNRMLGRSADQDYINRRIDTIRTFPDVPSSHWAYYQIVEGTNSHDYSIVNGKETWQSLK